MDEHPACTHSGRKTVWSKLVFDGCLERFCWATSIQEFAYCRMAYDPLM